MRLVPRYILFSNKRIKVTHFEKILRLPCIQYDVSLLHIVINSFALKPWQHGALHPGQCHLPFIQVGLLPWWSSYNNQEIYMPYSMNVRMTRSHKRLQVNGSSIWNASRQSELIMRTSSGCPLSSRLSKISQRSSPSISSPNDIAGW